MKELFAGEALAQIGKILTLEDRNPHSPTFGCFDRNFWQYKIIDFPSGMAQEFVYPLALVHQLDIPGNQYYQQEAVAQWIEAGIRYAMISSHRDGSCDDYFPYERAGGAAAFSLLALLESYRLMGFTDQAMLDFFQRRADWLANHHESGRLANHQALILLCLELARQVLKTSRYDAAIEARLDKILSWQSEEGWFYEYEGCDSGYLTLTLSCLGQYNHLQPSDRLRHAIVRGVTFVAAMMHPDGSFGGEYTSRNTYNYFPHGFELIGAWLPAALGINDAFLLGLHHGRGACYADDHIIGHHTWSYLLAWRDYVEVRPGREGKNATEPVARTWYQQAGLIIDRRDDFTLFVAVNKGGVFKLFHRDRLICSDTQFSLQVQHGKKTRNAVAHLVDTYTVHTDDKTITVAGQFGWAKQKQMTPLNLLILRVVMLTAGRYFPDLIRKLLQRVLITGKNKAPFTFQRTLSWQEGAWHVDDQVWGEQWDRVQAIGVGGHQTSIYVVMSRTFQQGQLQPWQDLTPRLAERRDGQPIRLHRVFSGDRAEP